MPEPRTEDATEVAYLSDISIEKAVVATLAYADIFDCGLTSDEVWRYLVGIEIDKEKLLDFLSNYSKSSGNEKTRFELVDGLWVLRGRREVAAEREGWQVRQDAKLAVVGRYGWLFARLRWVQLVAVTGSVAGGKVELDDDIDLLIICQSKRMWLSRMIITVVLSAMGARRKPNDVSDAVADLLCLNMWLSEDALSERDHDWYIANELARLKPVLNRGAMYERYLNSNEWAKEYLPNIYRGLESVQLHGSRSWFVAGKVVDWLDDGCRWVMMRMMRKRTVEVVTDSSLRFHPESYHSDILRMYRERIEGLMSEEMLSVLGEPTE